MDAFEKQVVQQAVERIARALCVHHGIDPNGVPGWSKFKDDAMVALKAAWEWQSIETAPRSFYPPISTINHHAPPILGVWGRSFYSVGSWGGPSQPYWKGGPSNVKLPFQFERWMHLPIVFKNLEGKDY